jgi:hypothetical protein
MKRTFAALLAALGLSIATVNALADVTYVDQVSQIRVGTPIGACATTVQSASFSGQASGGLPGTFNDTFCFTGPQPGPNVKETIVSGPWTLAGNNLAFSGQFCNGGVIQWNAAGTQASVNTALRTNNSTCGAPLGTGTLKGTWSRLYSPDTFNGTLTLTL